MLAYTDRWGMRTAYYFVITRERVIAGKNSKRDDCLLADIKQIDKKGGTITIETLVNKFLLWDGKANPSREMVDYTHNKLTAVWMEARRQTAPLAVTGPAASTGETKVCPFCAEEIKHAAVKCKHCGSDL